MVSLLIAVIYLAFISLGLPDSLLGSAWPSMYGQLNVPVSYAGLLSMIVSAGTIISSLASDRVVRRLGAGRVTLFSGLLTAAALMGYSFCDSYAMLCLMAIPYGLGAGSVDAALNNYVALHYSSRHMSWLHCMWGVGTVVGPYIMSYALTGTSGWNGGYRAVSVVQFCISAVLLISLPLWRRKEAESRGTEGEAASEPAQPKPLSLLDTLRIPGAPHVMLTFLCYCGAEATAMLWAGTYLYLHHGMDEETAAALASMFFIGMTVGRLISGFLTMKFDDTRMIRMGAALQLVGIAVIFLPFGEVVGIVGILLFGLGCAPIYPCIIHSTPIRFGAERSQAMIGVQMASAYIGSCLVPPLFGLVANHVSIALFPAWLLLFTGIMIVMHEVLVRKTKK